MLIDFTVSNFRSIHQAITLSLVASQRGKERAKGAQRKRVIPVDEEIGLTIPMMGAEASLLTVAGIFGANASGKSNVVKALGYLVNRLQSGPDTVPRIPFLLNKDTPRAPTHFALRLYAPETHHIFTYHLQLHEHVVEEELRVEQSDIAKEKVLFRKISAKKWEIDTELEPMRLVFESMASDTIALQILMKQFDLPCLAQLKTLIHEIQLCNGFGGTALGSFTCHSFENDDIRSKIINFIHKLDTGIQNINVELVSEKYQVTTFHGNTEAPVAWKIQEDSNGTRALFEISSMIISSLTYGHCLVLDEFGAFLHPHITQTIVSLFQQRETNPLGAQLIFNSHDLHLQTEHRMRRDQIWFTERRVDGSTELYPLTAFHPRNDESIRRNYGSGRYGAIPVLPGKLSDLVSHEKE